MALTAPLADDAAIFEYSYTTGSAGVYQLAGAWGGFFTFKSEWPAGAASIPIRVTDGSANTEISNAAYDAGANTLTVIGSPLTSTNGGAKVHWSGRTRLLVHALQAGIPLCPTPPTAGQTLIWDAVNNEWCPGDAGGGSITVCATTPWDGADLVWQSATSDWCPDSRVFGKPAAAASNAAGGLTNIEGGPGDGSGKGGDLDLSSGIPGSTGRGGDIVVTAADAGVSGNGKGGDFLVQTGTGRGTGVGGQIQLSTGDARGSGNGGDLNVALGFGLGPTARGGDINLLAGLTGNFSTGRGGNVLISAGDSAGGTPGQGGNVAINAGLSAGALTGGGVDISAAGGNGGDGGSVTIETGAASSGNQNGGDFIVTLLTGSGSGRNGLIIFTNLPTVNPGVSGALWNNGGVLHIA